MLGRLMRGAGWVAVGSALSQLAILGATPYLARTFTPAEFGALALLTTVSNIAVATACLRFDMALPSARDPFEARRLLTLCLMCCMSAATAVGLALTVGDMAPSLRSNMAAPFNSPVVVAVCIALAGAYQAAALWLIGKGAYRVLATLRTSQGSMFAALGIVPGLGLLWAHALSFGGGLATLAVTAWRGKDGKNSTIWDTAVRHKQLPLLSLPGALLDAVGVSVCLWVISWAYGLGLAGEYSQVQRLIGAPLMLVSMSLGQVLLRQTAEATDSPRELRALIIGTLKLLLIGAVVGMMLVSTLGEPLLQLVLGAQWQVDRSFITLVAAAIFIRACISPLSSVLVSLKRFDLGFRWQATYFCSATALLPLVAYTADADTFLIFFVFHELVLYGLYLWIILRAIPEQHSCVESLV